MNEEILENFGPLRNFAGVWVGGPGDDAAPSAERQKTNHQYTEKMVLVPLNPVANHEQKLFGLRYSTQSFRLGEADPFHDEVGYWLWDPKEELLFKGVTIPRGMVLLAGGHAKAADKSFKLKAVLGAHTFGICSNPFLDVEFQTVKYEIEMKFNPDGSFTYDQNSHIKIKGQDKLFEHRDINTLHRKSGA